MTEILLYGEVGWDFDASWLEHEMAESEGDVTLRVHSPGGDVFEGVAIANVIRHARADGRRVRAYVDGLCASAASYMCLTADDVVAEPGSAFMVHRPYGVCMGTAEDMREMAQGLEVCEDTIRDLYVVRTGRSSEDVEKTMRASTWMTAEDAVAFGLADRMGEGGPDLTEVDEKWSGISTNGAMAAFAAQNPALAERMDEYATHSNLLAKRLVEARESGFGSVDYTRNTFPAEIAAAETNGTGEAPEAGSGEAPRLFSDGWNVYRVHPRRGDNEGLNRAPE